MKSLEKIVKPKVLTMAHTFIMFALIIVMFFTSMGTIFTLEVGDGAVWLNDVKDVINEMSGEDSVDVEIPEKINVSFPFVVKSVGGTAKGIVQLFKSLSEEKDTVNTVDDIKSEADLNKAKENAEETAENAGKAISQNVINLVCLIMAIVTAFRANFVMGLAYLMILVSAIVIPIACIVALIKSIIAVVKNRDDLGKAFHKVSKAFTSVVSGFPIILLVLVLVPQIKLGAGVISMFAVSGVGIAVSLVASRLKTYEKGDFAFINVVQIASVGSLIAFLLFITNIAKTHILEAFFKNSAAYMFGQLEGALTNGQKIDFGPIIAVLIFVAALVAVCNYLVNILTRMSCMSSGKSTTHVISTGMGLAVVIVPIVCTNIEKFNFKLEGEALDAFKVAAAGVILMFVIEVVLAILSKTLCGSVDSDRKKEIVTGAYVHESVAAPAEKISKEAPVEEVSEEAPAEEVSEETPAEEVSSEEVPAEEETKEEV